MGTTETMRRNTVLTEAVNRFRQGEYSEALELFDQAICP